MNRCTTVSWLVLQSGLTPSVSATGFDETTQMGPLITARRVEAMEGIVVDAGRRGGRIEAGGRRPQIDSNGFFFSPTVISGLPDDAMALAEENLGPIAAITPFSGTEEVYRRANSSEFGRLAAYVFTRDPERIRGVSRIKSGMVAVNSFVLAAAEAPFRSVKASGMGREGGTDGILDF